MIKFTQQLFKDFFIPELDRDHSRLQQTLDSLPEALLLLDLEKKAIIYLNEVAKKVLGLNVQEFSPQSTFGNSYQAFDPQTGRLLDVSEAATSRIFRGEELKGVEFILVSNTGRYHIKVFSEKLNPSSNQPSSAIILFQDITALKEVERQLRETKDTLNNAVEVAQIGFWKYDLVTGHVILSPILMEQFGLDPDLFDHTLASTLKYVHPLDQELVTSAIKASIERRVQHQITCRVLYPPGQIRWIEANGAALADAKGDIVTLTGTTIDVTSEVMTRDLIQTSKEAVEHERNNFRSLFRQTPEMVCILSGSEHRFVFVNEAYKRALGFDATGKTVREAQPDSVEVFPILDSVYQTGVTAELSEIPVTVTGRLRYFNLTYAARRDLDNNIDGVMMLGAEVTTEVLSRQGLELQQEALKLALNDAPVSEFLEKLALSIEMQTGKSLMASILLVDAMGERLVHGAGPSLPEDYNALVNGIKIGPNVGSCGTAAHLRRQVIVEDIENDRRWADYKDLVAKYGFKACWSTPVLTANGSLLGTFALYAKVKRGPTIYESQVINLVAQTTALVLERRFEMNERQANAKALAESEADLNFTLESARMGTWKVDFSKNGLVTLSRKAQEIFGVVQGYNNPDEAIGDLIHPDDRAQVTKTLAEAVTSRKFYQDICRVLRKDGQIRWVELRGRPRYDVSGKMKSLTGLILDVTERKMSEAQLQASKLEAERANAAKSQFLANMSHEIRTPIGAIMGFSGLLKDENLSKEERIKFLSVIERNTNQLLRIIDDILDLSKVEAGMMAVEQIDFSLTELLTDISSFVGLKAREKGIVFTAKAMTPLPKYINTDPTRLRQILLNVIGNAVKFTDAGSVELRAYFSDGELYFEVQDSGRGISKEQEANLFKPFTQADPSITRKYGGTGLGLALTTRLTEALGGKFYLKSSEVGAGSVFSIMVKIKTPRSIEYINDLEYESNITPVTSNTGQLAGLKILLVEDSADNQALFSIYLDRAGAKTDIASDGAEGYELAMSRDYDIVLMDVQMPAMDGLTTIQKLREKGYKKFVIALTAHAMKEERVRCLEAGFTDFLSKPIRRKELIDVLTTYRNFLT